MNFRIALIPLALLLSTGAEAEIYKCVAEDGSVAYSQIPCPKQKSTTVRSSVAKTDNVVDCRWASQFANDVALRMRGGMASDAMFIAYGGVDSVSPGTVNIINYVYRFRGNPTMPLERISSLAASMCKAGSLGDVRCESLPYGRDPSGQICNPDVAEPNASGSVDTTDAVEARNVVKNDVDRMAASNDGRQQFANSDTAQHQCKKRYRDQIDAINAQMRSGYDSAQGEVYRERLRVLTTNLRAC